MNDLARTSTQSPVNEGDKAPSISLPDDQGTMTHLNQYLGKKVVLYFYPRDATPGCTTESQDFRDLHTEFQQEHTVIIGISKDSISSHDKFKCKQNLPFPLLSDEEGDVCERYGVWVEKNMYGKKYMGIQRATFLIDATGNVQRIWPKVSVKGHAAELLDIIKSS